jgi:hypothetical protein
MRIVREVGHGATVGATVPALRKRRARQERADARPAALLVQRLRPDLHPHAGAGQAAGPEGGCRAAGCQRPVDEPHRQAAGRLNAPLQAWLEPFAAASAQKPEPEGRAGVIELDERGHDLKKSPNRSGSGRLGSGRLGSGRLGSGRLGSGRLGIVLQGRGWTGNAAVVTRPPVSALSSG